MNTKQRKRQRDIKTKLMAAICMLLVSSIMMVSTTYAWFTLSTAPEVTGITTAVGANGNLEIALLPPTTVDFSKLDTDISSSDGDSMQAQAVELANITWGNLVDVGNSTIYGLDKITLYPAQLNASGTEGDMTIGENPLSRPEYGYDGRVTELKPDTLTGTYITQGEPAFQVNNNFGVRAIGTSSSMTDRELAYRGAMSEGNTAAGEARTIASRTLNTNGQALANIAIKHATTTEENADKYTKDDIQVMLNVVNALLGTDEAAVDGAFDYIEYAMKQYILANSIADITDAEYADVKAAIEAATLADLTDGTVTTAKVPDTVSGYVTTLNTSKEKVQTAKSTLNNLLTGEATEFGWNDFSSALSALVDPENMQLNGFAVKDLLKYENGQYVNVSKVLAAAFSEGLQLIMASESGVFADIADFCTDYTAEIQIEPFEYNGIWTPELPAKMFTQTTVGTTYLAALKTAVAPFKDSAEGAVSQTISDFYGYIIDLAFRTNAADSYLLLQDEAIDRVYEDNTTNEDTMGGGTYMSFTSTDPAFQVENVEDLMACLRIVIFEPDTRKIIGYAKLDTETASLDETTVKMNLIMCDEHGVAIADDTSTDDIDESKVVMKLDQNRAKAVSFMVYLDGTHVTNADVANGSSSMRGAMNLQFASSANLIPMELSDLRNGDDNDTDDSGLIVSSNTQNGETPAAPTTEPETTEPETTEDQGTGG